MSMELNRFLRNLSTDRSLLEAFEANPAAIVEDAELPESDKELLKAGDPRRWRRELIETGKPNPGGIM